MMFAIGFLSSRLWIIKLGVESPNVLGLAIIYPCDNRDSFCGPQKNI